MTSREAAEAWRIGQSDAAARNLLETGCDE
jgi:hypothetical protein